MSGPKISLSLGGARNIPPAAQNGVKRRRAVLHDEEEESVRYGKSEKVSRFDLNAGGAIDETKEGRDQGPLIITKQPNRDWKEAAGKRKRQKSALPGNGNDAVDQQLEDAMAAAAEARKPKYGLNIFESQKEVTENVLQSEGANGDVSVGTANFEAKQVQAPEPNGEASVRLKTDEELAMDALLGKTTTDKNLVLQQPGLSEGDAFRHDFAEAPGMASLEDYARVPVEQFGAALLRGMGWKDGEGIGSQRGSRLEKNVDKIPERRAALLGIGAKEEAAVAQEIGAWGKATKGGKKEIKIYNPVLLKDKKTGELFTEEELQKRQEREQREKYEREFDEKEQGREKRQKRAEHDQSRWRDRESDRHRSRGEDRDRREREKERREYVDESEEEYYRRKDRERRRRHERENRSEGESRGHRDRDDRRRSRHPESLRDRDRHR